VTTNTKAPGKKQTQSNCPEASKHGATNHCWQIEIADGPVSMGECSFCHAKREFVNYMSLRFNDRKHNVPMEWGKTYGKKSTV